MRYIALLTILLATTFSTAQAQTPKENLLSSLARTNDPEEQVRIYRNLADLCGESSEACGYLQQLVEKSRNTGQTWQMMQALTDLTINYIIIDKLDSVRFFMDRAEKLVPKNQYDQWNSYLQMRKFIYDLNSGNGESAVEERTAEFKTRDIAKESLYEQIEAEFILGITLEDKGERKEAVTYMRKAQQLAEELPFRESVPYQLLTLRQLGRLLNGIQQTEQAYEIIKTAIKIRKKYYDQYEKQERPFLSLEDFYISNYGGLLINIMNMPDKEIQYYLDKLVEMSDQSNKPEHKYSRFQAQYNYSAIKRDYKQALIYNDSLIRYARQLAVYNLPGLYNANSALNEHLGHNKEALENLRESYRLKDSIRQRDTQAQYDQLRVEHDINRLNFENSQLEIRNRHILLVFMSVVLLFVLILCFYLYSHLKRERQTKERMQALKLRAEESEKLKTAFINSICHEIRTPLNGIVGFAHLLIDPSIDVEERETFPAEIQANTDQLLVLIDSMLEVSNLDVSDELLPCEEIDLAALCSTIFDRHKRSATASNIESVADIPDSEMVIPTHQRYLSLVIDNLLANAYKFTEQGRVTLRCACDTDHVVLSVTDTGCGIAPENHNKVFERFTKLDIYRPGNGLGLYLCKVIVRRLSGQIFIDPAYNSGTRVVVILPLKIV